MTTAHSETASQLSNLRVARREMLLRLALVGAFLWLCVDLAFVVADFDWLTESDAGWYWSVAQNLQGFDPAVTIGYPLIWRGIAELVPGISPSTTGQIISLTAYVIMIPVSYEVFHVLNIRYAWAAALLVGLFPFVGVVYSLIPRTNSLLRLLTFLAILGYLKDKKFLFVFAAALLPLMHRSVLPMLGLLVLFGLWEHKISVWMLIPIGLPLAVYWIAGAIEHREFMWYLTGYKNPDSVLGLPIADGLLGTLVLGFRGSWKDLVQGLFLLTYWIGAVLLLASAFWRNRPVMLAFLLPVILLGLMQPADEIWSFYNYTTYSAIPFVVFLHQKNYHWLQSRRVWVSILVVCFLSQLAWAAYTIYFFSD